MTRIFNLGHLLTMAALVAAALFVAVLVAQGAASADPNPPNCPAGTNWDAVLQRCVAT